MTEQVASNKSSLLLKIISKIHKHYNYLHSILKQKLFTGVIKNANQTGLVWEFIKEGVEVQAPKVKL